MLARSSDLLFLHAAFRKKVEGINAELKHREIPLTVFEAFRSASRQAELFAQGPNVTRARPWTSLHQYGLAVDFALRRNGVWSWEKSPHWRTLHEIAAGFDLVPLSFEMAHLQPAGISLGDLQAGKFPKGGGAEWAANMRAAIKAHPAGAPGVWGVELLA
jgi:peptidoglycan LD-endopeptidase CwlK